MGFIGKGRIASELRGDVKWYVIMFVDSADGLEHEVGRCLKLASARMILKRWEQETLFEAPPPPVKYSSDNGVRKRSQSSQRFKKSTSSENII